MSYSSRIAFKISSLALSLAALLSNVDKTEVKELMANE